MLQKLASTAPNMDPIRVLTTGASEVSHVFQGAELEAVLSAYLAGIKDVFAFSLAGAAFTVVLSLAIPFKRLPDMSAGPSNAEEEEEGGKKDGPGEVAA